MEVCKRIIFIICILIITFLSLWLILFSVDYIMFKNYKLPIFCKETDILKDGSGTREYTGLGYKVFIFNRDGEYGMKFGSSSMDFSHEYYKFFSLPEPIYEEPTWVPPEEPNLSNKYRNLMEQENTIICKYLTDDIAICEDGEHTKYLLKNGYPIGFIKEINPNEIVKQVENKEFSSKQAYEVAKEYCEENVEKFEQYTLIENEYNEKYKQYDIEFNKKIGEYKTTDYIFISINTSHIITLFVAPNQEKFDEYQNIEIDNTKVSKFIEDEINTKYKEELSEYEEQYKTLKIVDDKLVLECSIKVWLNNSSPFLDIIYYYI